MAEINQRLPFVMFTILSYHKIFVICALIMNDRFFLKKK